MNGQTRGFYPQEQKVEHRNARIKSWLKWGERITCKVRFAFE